MDFANTQQVLRDGNSEYIDGLNEVEITFSKTFESMPKLFINVHGDANYKITAHSTTGFTMQFKDKDFVLVNYTGDFDWEAVPNEAFSD